MQCDGSFEKVGPLTPKAIRSTVDEVSSPCSHAVISGRQEEHSSGSCAPSDRLGAHKPAISCCALGSARVALLLHLELLDALSRLG